MTNKKLSPDQSRELLQVLKTRFEKNPQRHADIQWSAVQSRLEAHPEKLWSLEEMESSGGEPDVINWNPKSGEYLFCDCSAESPKDRRSLCYDEEALASRKENKPKGSALGMAQEMGISLLTEEVYRHLQKLGEFDTKTSSWIITPTAIRKLGGSLFGDRRFNHVFIYHNGAESYYAARGFRGMLWV